PRFGSDRYWENAVPSCRSHTSESFVASLVGSIAPRRGVRIHPTILGRWERSTCVLERFRWVSRQFLVVDQVNTVSSLPRCHRRAGSWWVCRSPMDGGWVPRQSHCLG